MLGQSRVEPDRVVGNQGLNAFDARTDLNTCLPVHLQDLILEVGHGLPGSALADAVHEGVEDGENARGTERSGTELHG